MYVQASGRLGNLLFQWAYANTLSKNFKSKTVIFFDKYHSDIDLIEEANRFLTSDEVTFKKSNLFGNICRLFDFTVTKFKVINTISNQLGILGFEPKNYSTQKYLIHRGFFQNYKFVEPVDTEIGRQLTNAVTMLLSTSDLLVRFPILNEPYQVLHIRLGDFKGSDFGVIKFDEQRQFLRANLHTVICTDGTEEEINHRFFGIEATVITPKETDAWHTLAILSRAELVIGSNSTLAWWGVYLAGLNGAETFLPKKYYKSLEHNSEDLQIPGCRTFNAEFE